MLPSGGVQMLRCTNCQLHFKSKIPTEEAPQKLFASEASKVWRQSSIPLSYEIELVKRFVASSLNTSVLDVGI